VDTHFRPAYGPWDQRLCFVPDGDLFAAISSGKASVVTDTIETFTEDGIRLASGAELPADLIVTATGLTLLAVSALLVPAVLLLRVLTPTVVRVGVGLLLAVPARGPVVAVVTVLLGVTLWLTHRWFLCVARSRHGPGCVGVHDRAGTELTRVQRLGAL